MQMYKRAWRVPRRPSSPGRMENRAGLVGRARRYTGGGSDRLACHTKVLSSADTEASVNEGVHRPGRIDLRHQRTLGDIFSVRSLLCEVKSH